MRYVLLAFLVACSPAGAPSSTTIGGARTTCATPYTEQNASPARAEERAYVTALLDADADVVALALDHACARAVDVGLGDAPRTDQALARDLAGALDSVPAGCEVVVLEELRLAIQPALDDATPARSAEIDRGRDALDTAYQVVVTCDGCPRLALALSPTEGGRAVCAWGRIPE